MKFYHADIFRSVSGSYLQTTILSLPTKVFQVCMVLHHLETRPLFVSDFPDFCVHLVLSPPAPPPKPAIFGLFFIVDFVGSFSIS